MAKHLIETLMSYAAGILFGIGVWLWIDATVIGVRDPGLQNSSASDRIVVMWYQWIPLVVSSIGLVLINLPPHNGIFAREDDPLAQGTHFVARVRIWLFFSFIVAFAALAAAIWLAVAQLLKPEVEQKWPGAALIVSNSLILISALVYRFQRAWEVQDDPLGI